MAGRGVVRRNRGRAVRRRQDRPDLHARVRPRRLDDPRRGDGHNTASPGGPGTSRGTATVRASSPPNAQLTTAQISSFGRSATFSFSATGSATGFQCAVVLRPTARFAPTPTPSYAACRSPDAFGNLQEGSYLFYVRAVGPGGVDRTPPTYSFTILYRGRRRRRVALRSARFPARRPRLRQATLRPTHDTGCPAR